LLAKQERTSEAEETISRAIDLGHGYGHFHHTAHNIASAYVAMNRAEDALHWLERASEDGFPNPTYFKVDPNLRPLQDHPQFIGFIAKLRLQWQRFKDLAIASAAITFLLTNAAAF
jgi:hypothetical protein